MLAPKPLYPIDIDQKCGVGGYGGAESGIGGGGGGGDGDNSVGVRLRNVLPDAAVRAGLCTCHCDSKVHKRHRIPYIFVQQSAHSNHNGTIYTISYM